MYIPRTNELWGVGGTGVIKLSVWDICAMLCLKLLP